MVNYFLIQQEVELSVGVLLRPDWSTTGIQETLRPDRTKSVIMNFDRTLIFEVLKKTVPINQTSKQHRGKITGNHADL